MKNNKSQCGSEKEKFVFTQLLEKLVINEFADLLTGFSSLFCLNITINIIYCYIKIIALECNGIINVFTLIL